MAGRRNDEWECCVAQLVCGICKEAMEEQGRGNKELATHLGVTVPYVGYMMRGENMKRESLGIQAALKLARRLGLEIGLTVDGRSVTDCMELVEESEE